ncbi:helix-turn-helix domain-containing protein [Pseudoalteromonas sp. KG3]|uniref:helix-turn-helix domain-containing protein n=1 Tax=Pseudoalteromonas sp. KG3 TaxID=2951137 RepID=UPI00265A5ECA|nr:helix-turn-helix domain-containing protein [Pseudoalteromonas sp. KG3]WKD23276.1 helix-turn-helix domain-containing protein [Pseudoalteromonas sp. KG3]
MVWVYTPTGGIADYVQAIWFANAQFSGESWLPCDGAKGVIFLISGQLNLAGRALQPPYFMQTISTQSEKVTFTAGTVFCGIRFKPAGLAHLQKVNHSLVAPATLTGIAQALAQHANLDSFIDLLSAHLNAPKIHHQAIEHTQKLIHKIINLTPLNTAYDHSPKGKRQLERYVKNTCDITAKHLARIYRVRQAKQLIKDHPQLSLAQLALECGFADQSHLNNEFNAILQITPAKYKKLIQQ